MHMIVSLMRLKVISPGPKAVSNFFFPSWVCWLNPTPAKKAPAVSRGEGAEGLGGFVSGFLEAQQ